MESLLSCLRWWKSLSLPCLSRLRWYGCDAMDGFGVMTLSPGLDVCQLPPAWSARDTVAAWWAHRAEPGSRWNEESSSLLSGCIAARLCFNILSFMLFQAQTAGGATYISTSTCDIHGAFLDGQMGRMVICSSSDHLTGVPGVSFAEWSDFTDIMCRAQGSAAIWWQRTPAASKARTAAASRNCCHGGCCESAVLAPKWSMRRWWGEAKKFRNCKGWSLMV